MKINDIKSPAARKFAVEANAAGFRVQIPTNTEQLVTVAVLHKETGTTVAEATWEQTHTGGNFSRGFAVGGSMSSRFASGIADGRFVRHLSDVRKALRIA